MKKYLTPLFFAISIIAFYIYSKFKLPPDVHPKGDALDFWIQILSLITAILSLIAAIIALIITVRQNKMTEGSK